MYGALVGGPEEGAHGEAPLVVDVAGHGEAVLPEEAVELPLRHRLVVGSGVARVVQWHPEAVQISLLLLRLRAGGEGEIGYRLRNGAHAAPPSASLLGFESIEQLEQGGGVL